MKPISHTLIIEARITQRIGKNKKGFHHTIKRLNLALLPNEECILVDVWYSKQLGHQVVAKMPRSHLHGLPSLAQLINVLNHMSKAKSEIQMLAEYFISIFTLENSLGYCYIIFYLKIYNCIFVFWILKFSILF